MRCWTNRRVRVPTFRSIKMSISLTPAGQPPGRLNGAALVAATGFANVADGVTKTVLPIVALRATSDPGIVGLTVACLGLPWVLNAVAIGVMVDRLDRRMLLSIAQIFRVLVVFVLGAVLATRGLTIALLLPCAFMFGVAEVLAMTAETAIVPMAVAKASLGRVNAWVAGMEKLLGDLVGPPLGGVLLAFSAPLTLGASGSCFLAALVLALALRGSFKIRRTADAGQAGVVGDVKDVFRLFFRRQDLLAMTLIVGIMAGCWSAWQATLVTYAVAPGPMNMTPATYGFLLSVLGAGGVVGASISQGLTRMIGQRWVMFGDVLGTAVMLGAPAVSSNPIIVGAGAFFGGVGGMLWVINARMLIQRTLPGEMLGRFYAVYRTISWSFLPLGAALGGYGARLVGVHVVFIVGAGISACLTLPFFAFLKPSMFREVVGHQPGDRRAG